MSVIVDHDLLAENIAERLRPLRVLRAKDAAAKLGISRSQFYELRKEAPDFPDQITFAAAGISGYYEHELDEWMRRNGRR